MPRVETVLRLFVASPSDLVEERSIVEEVVTELNSTWSKHLGIRLETVRWESHAFPAIGGDPQAVINSQIQDDYDIFLGIIWTRFGTATPRAASGTAEEFHRAHGRYRADPKSVKIMFYFKTAPVSPSELDPSSLAEILDFRKQLGELGSLYWTFSDRDDFAAQLRVHLSRQVQEFVAGTREAGTAEIVQSAREAIAASAAAVKYEDSDDDELGILDLAVEGHDAFTAATEVMVSLTAELDAYTRSLGQRTLEMQNAVESGEARAIWTATKHAADDMEAFATTVEVARPRYADATQRAFAALSKAVALVEDLSNGAVELRPMLTELRTLSDGVENSRQSIEAFRITVASTPRVTAALNRARRHLVSALDSLIHEFDATLNLIRSVDVAFQSITEGYERTEPTPDRMGR